jgi:hypothetical protein
MARADGLEESDKLGEFLVNPLDQLGKEEELFVGITAGLDLCIGELKLSLELLILLNYSRLHILQLADLIFDHDSFLLPNLTNCCRVL